ncbi:MAG: ATP-dependent DNA helicase [Candidatus Nanopelagicales bacterium]|nr:ATP-dependent DNA helicase [Candidatus Nanopelagicales bacterium]
MSEIDDALDKVVEKIGGERREGQHAMAKAVASTIQGDRHAIIQAGTGTGKSLGYLVPAAIAAIANKEPIVVATATLALQRQLMDKDLPLMVEALQDEFERPITYAVLKGRNNYICLQKLHGAVPDDESDALFNTQRSALGEQVVAVRAWAEKTQTGDRDEYDDEIDPRVWRSLTVGRRECVGESKCVYGEDCFTAKRRAQANEADIIITNHAMLAIDALENIPVLPEHGAVIIDEGHELVDRATGSLTNELSVAMVERSLGRSKRLVDEPTLAQLQDAMDAFDDELRELCLDLKGPTRLDPMPQSLTLALTLLRDSGHQVMTVLNANKEEKDPDALAKLQQAKAVVEEMHDTAGLIINSGDYDVVWLDPGENRAPVLRRAPLSIGGLLRDSLFAKSPVVLTSATLTVGGGFDSLIASLGLTDADVNTMDVGSPFDHAKQGILYVARELPAPDRDGVPMEALDTLAELIEAAGGRTLALFSSWRGVERAAEYLRVRLDNKKYPMLVQKRGDAVGTLVKAFAETPATTLLGTVSLWQGVDVPGESCICVVIDRIPFPRPDDPLIAARQQAIDDAGGSGFRAISVPKAGLLLAQGVGRLIRGANDKGVVAVLDSRLANAGYAKSLRASLPPFWFTTDKEIVVGSLKRLNEDFLKD